MLSSAALVSVTAAVVVVAARLHSGQGRQLAVGGAVILEAGHSIPRDAVNYKTF